MQKPFTHLKKSRPCLSVPHLGAKVSQVWFTHVPAGIQVHLSNSEMSEQTPEYSKVRDRLSSSVWNWVPLQRTIKFIEQREEEPLAQGYRSHHSAGMSVKGRAFSTNGKCLKGLWSWDPESCFLSFWSNFFYFVYERDSEEKACLGPYKFKQIDFMPTRYTSPHREN